MTATAEGTGHFIDERCPKCGATLLGNARGEKWCSFIGGRLANGSAVPACDFGIEGLSMTSTALKPWAELEGRERDAATYRLMYPGRVLEELAGEGDFWARVECSGTYAHVAVPHYTTNAADDYSVLEFVRKEWPKEMQWEFGAQLCDAVLSPELYTVGSYSAAAYEALRLSQEGER